MKLTGVIVGVFRSSAHIFSKEKEPRIRLLAGHGVEGDAHAGRTVQHRSRVAVDPSQPNLRQVHLIPAELFDELLTCGYKVLPGQMGENLTTRGLELLRLPTGSRLRIGAEAVIEITGLRNPCSQLDHFQRGLMSAVLIRDENGRLLRKAGVMGVVVKGGLVGPGDAVRVELPPGPPIPLQCV